MSDPLQYSTPPYSFTPPPGTRTRGELEEEIKTLRARLEALRGVGGRCAECGAERGTV